ncbi:MAG: LacI family DNA-binding transcriptional regulator [Caldilineaceae bacterium]
MKTEHKNLSRVKKSTLREIAERAGVSMMTASNVINQKEDHYSSETRERVLRAATDIGYVPNPVARHLRKGRVGLIALVIPDILNPYYSELSQHIITEAEAAGYTVLIHFTNGERDKERLIISGTKQLTVDGIILDPLALDPEDIQPSKIHTPLILLGARRLHTPYDHVMIDDAAAAKLATEHLIQIGRKRIAPIGVTAGTSKGMPYFRLEGFKQALREAGLFIDEAMLMPTPIPRFDRAHGAMIMEQLLALPAPPDAVFCFNDLVALGAMRLLLDHGYRVPDDVAVIGFDNIVESKFSVPPLSTIAQGRLDMSRLALRLLLERVEGKRTDKPETVTASFRLIPRTSTIGKAYPSDLHVKD